MIDKIKIAEQTKAAFDFIEKLYIETSYLIKQLEGVLAEEPENFIIGRPAGYNVTARSSQGLEVANVRLWLRTKLSVFFIPKAGTHLERGQSLTKIEPNLKVLYFRFLLNGREVVQPLVYSGVLFDIAKKTAGNKWPSKFEHIMGHIEYNDEKVFRTPKQIEYEDAYIVLKGKLVSTNLYDINDSGTVMSGLVIPSLNLYRG